MGIPVALIPVLRPLYRYPVWRALNRLKGFELELYTVEELTMEGIAFIPMDTIRSEFKHRKLRNLYIPPGMLFQSGVLKTAFGKNKALIFSGNIRCISTWVTAVLGRLMGKKIYFWSHGAYGNESGMTLRAKKLFFRIPHGTFLYGNHALKTMRQWGMKEDRLHVIYNSLDHAHHLKLRKKIASGSNSALREHFGNDRPVLLFIGRLTPQKKLPLLFKAVRQLEDRQTFVNILIIGEGSEREQLQEIASGLQSQTWFYGKSYEDMELSSLIAGADLCISPGNVGLTAIHCMSFGTPVISHGNKDHQMPESEAIIPGRTGLLFDEGSSDSLANSIQEWLDYQQENGRKKIREDCYQVIDTTFNPGYQTEVIRKVLSEDLKINIPQRHGD